MGHRASSRLLGGLAALAAALAALSCTPERKHRLLTFFFDGVPPLHPPEAEGPPEPAAGPPQVGPTVVEEPAKPRIVWSEHAPALDKTQCGACHDRNASYALTKPLEELCIACHERQTRQYPRMHGPVAIGACATCHEAHRSPHKHLVRAPSPQLCLRCHEPTPEGGATRGCARSSDEADCLGCHHPHGGKEGYFLAARQGTVDEPKGGPPPSPHEVR
jgi:predicted CXXCH cytochrome family protein